MLSINDISIITVTFNSEKIIRNFLLQSELEKFNDQKIIIVDNRSDDKTINVINNIGKKYKIIHNMQNLGYGKGVNIGMTAVKSKYCLIVNPDLIFEKNFFTNLLNGIERNIGFRIFFEVWASKNEAKIDFFSQISKNGDFAKIVLPSRQEFDL